MAKLVAKIIDNHGMIGLYLGSKEIDTLFVQQSSNGNRRYQVCRTIENRNSLCGIQDLYYIEDYDGKVTRRCRLVLDKDLNNTEILEFKFAEEILFKGTELQCIKFAKQWLANEYSV